jgi:DNA-binding transcriptional ArsR family regulator
VFANEASMIEPLRIAAVARWALDGEPWLVVTEHKADTRIPDLVLARVDETAVEQRVALGCQRPLNRAELTLFLRLRRNCGTSVEVLARHSRVTRASASRTLRALERDGFVAKQRSGCWRPIISFRPLVTRFVSFEAKRSDWRCALAQARAHRLFANEAYVVFDPSFATRFERNLEYYRISGIGLLALGGEPPSIKRILRSRRGRALDQISAVLAGEEIWSRLLGLSTTPLPQTRLPSVSAPSVDREAPGLAGARSKRLERLLSGLLLPSPA